MLRWIHGWPVPEQLAIGNVKEAFDEDDVVNVFVNVILNVFLSVILIVSFFSLLNPQPIAKTVDITEI